MKREFYNTILDKPPADDTAPGTLSLRIEGSIGEDHPSDRHRYTVTLPDVPGSYTVDFSGYVPKYRYPLEIAAAGDGTLHIRFDGAAYTLREGVNVLFERREYQGSYDGPWFTGVDRWLAVWTKADEGSGKA